MRSGELRDYLELQTPVETRGADGSVVTTWLTETHLWGEVRGLSGREYMQAQQAMASTSHEVLIRWDQRVTSGKRLLWNPGGGAVKTLNIGAVADPDGRRREMRLQTTEIVSELLTVLAANCSFTTKTVTLTFSGALTITEGGADAAFEVSVNGTTWYASSGVNIVSGSPHMVELDFADMPSDVAWWRLLTAPTRVVGTSRAILVPQSGSC